MGEYIIQGNAGYESIPVINAGYPADYTKVQMIPISVDYGTLNEPVRIWQSGNAFMDAAYFRDTQNVQHWRIKWCTLPGWPGANTDETNPNITDLSGNLDTLYIGAIYSQDGDNPATSIMSWSEDGSFPDPNCLLYNGAFDNMGAVIGGDWDETPTPSDYDDPSRTSPQGGEYADRDPFGQTTDIDLPGVPDEIILADFITIYSLNGADIAAIGTAIFTDNTWTNFQNKFIGGIGDPISYIISAVEVPVGRTQDGTKKFNLGGVNVVTANNTEIPVHYARFRYKTLDFGSITLKEVWGSEKDYSQTSVAIYLPYVGVHDLDTAQLMNSTIHLKGCLDITNGDLMYALVVSKKNRPGVYVESHGITYRFQGNCGRQIPIGKVDSTTQLLAMTGAIASMGIGLASGMPFGAGGYNPSKELWASGDYEANMNTRALAGGGAGILGAAAMGPKVSMSAGLSGAIGRADVQQPYLIITQNVPVYPNNWREHFGAPRYQTFTISDVHGYTQFADYHAEQIEGANDAERAAIEQAMKAGVFLP